MFGGLYKDVMVKKERKKHWKKTRPVEDWFQDYCKNWSLNPGFCFFVCIVKKRCHGYYVIQSSNHQKLIEEKRLSKCDVIIKHLGI